MHEEEFSVRFEPSGKTAYVLAGTRLVEAAAVAGLNVDLPCGGEGTCGKCRVRLIQGAVKPTISETDHFSQKELDDGWRLACQTTVERAAVVEIPQTSLLETHHKILADLHETASVPSDPNVRKQFVELSVPQRGDDDADLIRLEKAVGPIDLDLDMLRELPSKFRKQGFSGTAVMLDGELIDFEPGDTRDESFAVAVDLGTTTLAAVLLDLDSGVQRAVVSRLNPQTTLGDDVLSRILHSRENPQGLNELHESVTTAVNEMVGELADEAGVDRRRIYEVVLAGNTTMQQLFCRIDPASLGEIPFVPATGHGLNVTAAKLGLCIHPRGRLHVMPVIGGFVGGDTVAGILATEMAEANGPTLLVDIGTNGEIVLACDGRLRAASTAAGPAFEGARISQGMRGSHGAIEKVLIENSDGDARLRFNVIGNLAPVGLCGSALIDLSAELLRQGILLPQGRLCMPHELPSGLSDDLRDRVLSDGKHASFMLATASESDLDRAIVVTQADFRELQLASGAIRAGVDLLLRREGLSPGDLDRV
ncbi:MAG: DUF4445 domain-containing protein, partial [Pirellulales bacterium]|nr:DUF4445 domain-containing protein [Pirellulales bacterium]